MGDGAAGAGAWGHDVQGSVSSYLGAPGAVHGVALRRLMVSLGLETCRSIETVGAGV
jgi:hypothetical protein